MRLALAMLALSATAAAAQPVSGGQVRLELWGAFAAATPVSGGSLASDYAPLLVSGSDYTSHAAQTMTVDTGWGHGVDVGANVFLSPWFGIQGSFLYSRAAISGTGNSDYLLDLRYVARQPPDYQPREYHTSSATAWADTEGSLSYRAIFLGGVFRVGRPGGRVSGTIAGGVSIAHITADVQSLAYSEFRLGGHSTLFESRHRVSVGTGGAEARVGPYVGGDVSAHLNPHVAAFGGIRVEMGPQGDVAATPDALVDPAEDAFPPDISEVQRVMALGPMHLPTSRWHLLAGIKILVR
jgi:hypothetical protein